MANNSIYIESVIPHNTQNVQIVNDIYMLASTTAAEIIALFREAGQEKAHRNHLMEIKAMLAMFPQNAEQLSAITEVRVGGKVEVLLNGANWEIHRVSENLVYGLKAETNPN